MRRRALVSLVLAALLGCGNVLPRTQVTVVIDADSEVRALTESLRLEVFGGPRGGEDYPAELSDDLPVAGPIAVAGHACGGAARRRCLAPVSGGSDRSGQTSSGSTGDIASARVITGFVSERSLQVTLFFYASCLELSACDPRDETCGPLGTCVSARQEPVTPPTDGATPPTDGGMDGGTLDATVPPDDAGSRCTANSECDDGNPCTDDLCTVTGCVSLNNNGGLSRRPLLQRGRTVHRRCVREPRRPLQLGTTCEETSESCVGCTGTSQCPPPEVRRDPCDYGTNQCANFGSRTTTITQFVCDSGACVPGTATQEVEMCMRDTSGTVCAPEVCEDLCATIGFESCTSFACDSFALCVGTQFNRPCIEPPDDGGVPLADAGDSGPFMPPPPPP